MSKAVQWTPQQLEAIRTTGTSLLVSAAAGSGKTAVLAERCVHLVCDAKPRCNVNQLLVVTFTEAAAAEMKGRIEQALRNRLESAGEDEHLRRQFALIEHANVSTLHSFCNRLLRQHFHRLGLDPAFRVLDSDEATLIRLEVVRDLFMECYDRPNAQPFHQFIDSFGEGDDQRLMRQVVQTHELLNSLVDPQQWRKKALTRIAEAAAKPLEESELGREYLAIIQTRLEDLGRDCRSALQSLQRMPGFDAYVAYLNYLSGIAQHWAELFEERGYDGLVAAAQALDLQRLPSIRSTVMGKEVAQALVSRVQEQFKKGALIEGLRFSSSQWEEGLRSIRPHAQVFLELVEEFGQRYAAEKSSARALDFADLERFALQLLSENALRPSPVARMLHKQFQHVLVDEYQDINEVQDAILTLASRECLLPPAPLPFSQAKGQGESPPSPSPCTQGEGRGEGETLRPPSRPDSPIAPAPSPCTQGEGRGEGQTLPPPLPSISPNTERPRLLPGHVWQGEAPAREGEAPAEPISRLIDKRGSDAASPSQPHPSATPNLFCVGDVKQSIYGFRLAEPGRFLDRHARFGQDPDRGKVVDLQANFRSRGPLIEVLNGVFERLMVKAAADIEYDHSQRLHAKAQFPDARASASFTGAPIELHCMPETLGRPSQSDAEAPESTPEDDSAEAELERSEREALLVARRIQEMMGQHGQPHRLVAERGKDGTMTYRPLAYRDIVVLLRATRYHADEYADVLRQHGIPVFNSSGGGYFDTMEVRDILSLLRLLDNQQQDIPLAAVLRSPLSGLARPEDCLAMIRLAWPDASMPFHQAVRQYALEKDDELAAKLRDFLAELSHWRTLARQQPVADVIWAIYERSGYLAFCNGLENGQQRCANLIHLYERARQFGTFTRQGLYRFIRFLESLKEETDAAQASELSEAEDVVRIMSIHKSKGLEFPVVFLPEMGKRINFQGCTGNIVADRRAFLGLTAVNEFKRIRYPSLASMLVSEKLRRQALAEELRVLYVAMTRAKEHLILVGTSKPDTLEAWSRRWDLHTGPMPPNAILNAKTMLDWLGPVAAMLGQDGGQSIQVYEHPAEEIEQWLAGAKDPQKRPETLLKLARLEELTPAPPMHPAAQQVIARLSYTYPHRPMTTLQATQSVTTWTKRPQQGPTPQVFKTQLENPRCLLEQAALSATERGTAVHLFMEHLDFSRPCTDADLAQQLEALVTRKTMTRAQADAADLATVRWFLQSDLGRLVIARAPDLLRELPLYYALPPDRIIAANSPHPMDQIMIRGRIDLLVPDEQGFVLIDYKTDHLRAGQLEQRAQMYKGQMDLYREAIERITGRQVHAACLVFLAARQVTMI